LVDKRKHELNMLMELSVPAQKGLLLIPGLGKERRREREME
jgi:hypothetical protein